MPTPNGKDIRTYLYDELFPTVTSVAANGKFKYLPYSFNGVSPVICLPKGEADRGILTQQGSRTTFYMPVWMLTLYIDTNGVEYDESAGHDLLDDIETQLATAIDLKRSVTGKWRTLTREGRSQVLQPYIIRGDTYNLEICILKVEVF